VDDAERDRSRPRFDDLRLMDGCQGASDPTTSFERLKFRCTNSSRLYPLTPLDFRKAAAKLFLLAATISAFFLDAAPLCGVRSSFPEYALFPEARTTEFPERDRSSFHR
jgi:hypothetical protein